MKKTNQNCRLPLVMLPILVCLCTFLLLTTDCRAQYAPGVQWTQVQAPRVGLNHQVQTRDESGEDWWYSHKNLYNAAGTHTGYVMVGYSSLLSFAGSSVYASYMYDEGPLAPSNPIQTPYYSNYGVQPYACDQPDYVGELRTPTRGNLGIADLNGNMLWCRPRTINDLQEVVQDVSDKRYVYVIGTHQGSRPYYDQSNFIAYNPTSANPADYFTTAAIGVLPAEVKGHMYVAKIDITLNGGTKIWEGLYGYTSYTAGAGVSYTNQTTGYDIEISASGTSLIAVGVAQHSPFVVAINPANGYVINSNILNVSGYTGPTGKASVGAEGRSVVEIANNPGKYAIACLYKFTGTDYATENAVHSAAVWAIDGANLMPLSTWTANPVFFHGTGYNYNSTIWEINYHNTLNQLMVPVIKDCNSCFSTGANEGYGFVYRLNTNGSLVSTSGVTNPSPMGPIHAFDLRAGVAETSDGGFIAVSSRRPVAPTNSAAVLPYFYCADADPSDYKYWDTDALVVKYDFLGATSWERVFDVNPGRGRQSYPGDTKQQECLYKITQAGDGGYAISGNCSFNFDDSYMAKLASECQVQQSYALGPGITTISVSTTWSTSMNVWGKVVVNPGCVLTISGNTTKIRFADTKLSGVETHILVRPGAKLSISAGAELTSIDNSVCGGSMWDGILVAGNPNGTQALSGGFGVHQGLVTISSSTISNARTAINTYSTLIDSYQTSGGIISAFNSDFTNNVKDVAFLHNYTTLSRSEFKNCRFLTTSVLNNGLPVEGHISMWEMRGVLVQGCTFAYSAGSAYPPEKRGYGIYTENAKYKVENYLTTRSKFENLSRGVVASNTNPLCLVEVDKARFNNIDADAIQLATVNGANITNNSFTLAPHDLSTGVYLHNCKNYLVGSNAITGSGSNNGVGIIANRSGSGSHKIYNNYISNLYFGIEPQYNNSSGFTDQTDGLVMNCNDFTSQANAYDIIVRGDPIDMPHVAYNQGVINSTVFDPKNLVRNQYAATCGAYNKWYIYGGLTNKPVIHPSFTTTSTRPNYPNTITCANSAVNVIAINTAFNASLCPTNSANRNTGRGATLSGINVTLNNILAATASLSAFHTSTVDKGNTQALLDDIVDPGTDPNDLRDLLLLYSPYLSDTVLESYFSIPGIAPSDLAAVHNANKPVCPEAWEIILAKGYGGALFTTLESQQAVGGISVRQALDGELAISRNDLQDVYRDKATYFLNDTLLASQDSLIRLLALNEGNLPDAMLQLVHAYQDAGYTERAFDVVDSLVDIPAYTELMGLQAILMQLDTSAAGIYSILDSPTILSTVRDYAMDSTKQGFFQAQALLRQVEGREMFLPHLMLPPDESRRSNQLAEQGWQDEKLLSAVYSEGQPQVLKIYPNPANDNVTIFYSDNGVTDLHYQINDLLGTVLAKGPISRRQAQEINTMLLNNGLYIISIQSGELLLDESKLIILK